MAILGYTMARLRHGDWLKIGSKTLSVHVHVGSNTCSGCEPGLAGVCSANQALRASAGRVIDFF